MKKIAIVAVILGLVLCLVGCEKAAEPKQDLTDAPMVGTWYFSVIERNEDDFPESVIKSFSLNSDGSVSGERFPPEENLLGAQIKGYTWARLTEEGRIMEDPALLHASEGSGADDHNIVFSYYLNSNGDEILAVQKLTNGEWENDKPCYRTEDQAKHVAPW